MRNNHSNALGAEPCNSWDCHCVRTLRHCGGFADRRWPANRFWCKETLLCIGVFYFAGRWDDWRQCSVYSLPVSSGVSASVSPPWPRRYISGNCAAEARGRLAGMFQFNIVFGILDSFRIQCDSRGSVANAWRWMLGVAAFPSLLYAVSALAFRKARDGYRAKGGRSRSRNEGESTEQPKASEQRSRGGRRKIAAST